MAGTHYKILHILEATGGGTGRHIVDLCGHQLQAGHEVHLFYSPTRMQGWFKEKIDALPGIYATPLPMRRGAALSDISNALALRRYLKRYDDITIVHGHSSKGGLLAALATLGTKRKAIYTPHDFRSNASELKPFGVWFYRKVEWVLGALADKVIAVSPEEQRYAIETLHMHPAKVAMVANGIASATLPARMEVRKELGLAEKEIVLGFIGRMVFSKGPDLLLRVLAALLPHYPALRPVVLGEGELVESIQEEAASLGLKDRVIWRRRGAGQELMPAFDIFLLPSRNEGMPYVYLEAMQAGLPIVTTRVGGHSLAVEEGVNGFSVAVEDVDAMVEKLRLLLDDVSLRRKMGSASLMRVQQFSLERMAAETAGVYGSEGE